MSWPALESAYVSICVVAPAADREYEARATSTPPRVESLPIRVKRLVSMQSAAGPVYAFGPVVVHGFGLLVPPIPGPSMRTKFVPRSLPVAVCGVAPSPTYPAGGTSAGSAVGAHFRN